MFTIETYYRPPPDSIFEEIKKFSMELWRTYEDEDYVSEKIRRIENIENIQDNACYMVAMFDWVNQGKLLNSILKGGSEETYVWLLKLIDREEQYDV